MGMILGHHIPPPTGFAPAVDTCSYAVKFDGPSPHPTNLRFRYDIRARPDGLRFWTRHGGVSHPAFDNLFQYDAPAPWQLSGWVLSASVNITGDTFVRTIDWHDEGRKLTRLDRWFSGFRRIDTLDQSATPYDITVLGPAFASRTGIPGTEFLIRFNLEASAGGTSSGSHCFISRAAFRLERHLLTTPHDISTMVIAPDQVFDATPFNGRMDQCGFSADHTKLYASTSAGDLCSWDLTAPDDISAPFNFQTGVNINEPPYNLNPLGIARGLLIRPDTGDLIYFGDQNNYRVRCWAGGIAPSTDPAFSEVVLLLDMAGPDGGTNITDLSNSGHTETFHGNAQIDVLVRAKGQNTLFFDGTGDLIDYPQSSDFDFGTGDFTVECSVRWDGVGTGGIISTYDVPTTNGGWWLQWSAGNLLRWGQADFPVHIQRSFTPTIGQMYDIAITRDGTDLRMFIDGVQQGATETNSTDYSGSTRGVSIGALQPPAVQDHHGYIGAVRITKGTGRYTSGYTPGNCFFPGDPVPPSPVVASGAPSITKPTSAGAAVVTSAAAIEAGAPIVGTPAFQQTVPASPTEAAGDRIFVYGSNEVPNVDGTWTQLATAPTSFHVYTKVAAGDATDVATTGGGAGNPAAVMIKFTMKDIAGSGSWDFDFQSTLRNTARAAFDCNGLGAGFGVKPSCSFFAGLRIASGVTPGLVGDFSDPLWNAPPNGGTILKVKTQQPLFPFNTYWSAISFLCEPTKVVYATGKFWSGADSPNMHTTQTRGWRYDHD